MKRHDGPYLENCHLAWHDDIHEQLRQAELDRLFNEGDLMDQSIIAIERPAEAPKPTPEQAGSLARAAYRARCEKFGLEVDPVSADEEYWRAYRAAQGRAHYAGD